MAQTHCLHSTLIPQKPLFKTPPFLLSVLHTSPRKLPTPTYGLKTEDQLVTSSELLNRQEEDIEIEGLQKQYCDDFVCNCGPAVEQNLRALQRDIGRGKWSLNKFAQDVKYSDTFRRFGGVQCYERNNWARDCVENYYARVDRVQMAGLNTAVVDWIMSGSIGPTNIKVTFQDTFVLNPLTGRVEQHRSQWDLSACTFPARLAFTASRLAWSLKQSSKDTQQQIEKVADVLSSRDEDDEMDIRSSADPTRMFLNSQREQQNEEMFVYALAVAILYLIYVAAKTIFFG
eukprot:TRINITY_DN1843_c0_g1_i1.p1 TRINITY_DN1843_c0_g1~~TRINITY_DN1843_c0_g1_i1.p1  ORF type:complete len:301 (-),score=24.81 TRINITY_DN1843_c0_g1_i1:513-1373(-)